MRMLQFRDMVTPFFVKSRRYRWFIAVAFIMYYAMMFTGCNYYGDAGIFVSGVIRDSMGQPVYGAEVEFTPTKNSGMDEKAVISTSDENGKYGCSIMFSPQEKNPEFLLKIHKAGFTDYTKVIKHTDERFDIVLKR